MNELDVECQQLELDDVKKNKMDFTRVVLRFSSPGRKIVRVRSKYGYTKYVISFNGHPLLNQLQFGKRFFLYCMGFIATIGILGCMYLHENTSPKCSMNTVYPGAQWGHSGACTPVTDIFFLKTHKCASSSVQNILMRFGDDRNLTFVLPTSTNYIGHPEKFSRSMISSQRKPVGGFNILCHHLRLNTREVRSVLRPSAIFLTILREPVSLFRSMYDYYEVAKDTQQTLDQFVRNETSMGSLSNDRFRGRIGDNQMMYDLGFDTLVFRNETLISQAIKEVDDTFDFVMISELFDESLILLRHMLCWSMEDILYLVHNRRMSNTEWTPYFKETSERINQYNKADRMLYDHFAKKLERAIDDFGREKMAREVQDLRTWNKVWFDHCVRKLSVTNKKVPMDNRAYSSKVYSFVLRDEPIASLCKNLAMVEIPYTEKLIQKQKTMF